MLCTVFMFLNLTTQPMVDKDWRALKRAVQITQKGECVSGMKKKYYENEEHEDNNIHRYFEYRQLNVNIKPKIRDSRQINIRILDSK